MAGGTGKVWGDRNLNSTCWGLKLSYWVLGNVFKNSRNWDLCEGSFEYLGLMLVMISGCTNSRLVWYSVMRVSSSSGVMGEDVSMTEELGV
jgi:hypothetical protein